MKKTMGQNIGGPEKNPRRAYISKNDFINISFPSLTQYICPQRTSDTSSEGSEKLKLHFIQRKQK